MSGIHAKWKCIITCVIMLITNLCLFGVLQNMTHASNGKWYRSATAPYTTATSTGTQRARLEGRLQWRPHRVHYATQLSWWTRGRYERSVGHTLIG